MPVAFFDITRQNSSFKDQLSNALSAAVNSGRYILGPNVSEFEKEAAKDTGVNFSVGVASGTDALHLGLRAAGIKAGDEVITTPFTFVATIEAIIYCGATPVFADIDPNTFNLDPDKIEEKITKKTKAILPVHLFGLAANMASIMDIAKKHNLIVVEDCAQAQGAEFNGKKVGSFGIGCFSFFPTKNLGCFGDGGMITTNDEKAAEEIKVLRGHGVRTTYHYDILGFNSRLDEIQAAVLRVKLPYLGQFIKHRRENADLYRKELKDVAQITLPFEPKECIHTYNQFTIRTKNRQALIDKLKAKDIGAMVYYPLALHLQEAYQHLGYKLGDFPQTELAQDQVLSLPIYPELMPAEIEHVCQAIKA